MELVPVIGLETHIQLKTSSKLFCACKVAEDGSPNAATCPVCLGHPGTLPTLNEHALKNAIRLGLALGGTIARTSKFDRKHYFYPDLPKGYQISQFDLPLMTNGTLSLEREDGSLFSLRIERLHLEEDAGKNIHDPSGKTYVDFSRGGTALCEIVTHPDFTNAGDAKKYLQELRLIVRTLGVSDGDMEKGQLRCDVNVSLREVLPGGTLGPLHPKTEVKNINSFKAVEKAILFEIARQTALWEKGDAPNISTTRSWNDETGETELRREKESSADYRYFPEPDLPPLKLEAHINAAQATLPELPSARRTRLVRDFGMRKDDVDILVERIDLTAFFDAVAAEASATTPKTSLPRVYELLPAWILVHLIAALDAHKKPLTNETLTPKQFLTLLEHVAQSSLTVAKAKEVLVIMIAQGTTYEDAVVRAGAQTTGAHELENIVANIIAQYPEEVARYRSGETKLLAFFLGQVMKATEGNAHPGETKTHLLQQLQNPS